MTPTHAALVQRAARWLAGTGRCPVVFTEFSTGHCPESPDAIGWRCGGGYEAAGRSAVKADKPATSGVIINPASPRHNAARSLQCG